MGNTADERSVRRNGRDGYLKACRYCGERIYMMRSRHDGRWRPFESWIEGNAAEGEWSFHDCSGSWRAA